MRHTYWHGGREVEYFTHTRYAITMIGRDGLRTLMFANQGRNHYMTREEAEKAMVLYEPGLRNAFGNEIADSLAVREVECYEHGDAVGIYFETDTTEPAEG